VNSSGKRRRPKSRRRPDADSARNVFINCPFDDKYRPLFHAAVFAIVDCGFVPRCALEVADGSEVRINKVCDLIAECRFGIHDLSRTELDARSKLPRFNMPLELGLFIGAKRFGGSSHHRKSCLILDTDPYRYQAFISDIAGQDIRPHGGDHRRLITAIRDWLRATSRRATRSSRSPRAVRSTARARRRRSRSAPGKAGPTAPSCNSRRSRGQRSAASSRRR